jgi:hypothetical protein
MWVVGIQQDEKSKNSGWEARKGKKGLGLMGARRG